MNFYVQADPDARYIWPFIYFHGELALENDARWNDTHVEDLWCAPDLVSSDISLDSVKDGIHPCLVYGEACRLYLWHSHRFRPGLIVKISDEVAKKWAEEKYTERSSHI